MKQRIYVFIPVFMISLILISMIAPTVNRSEHISENIFRLHILANSDTAEDQELKLKVRDKVLRLTEDLYTNCESVSDAVNVTHNNIGLIKETAQKVIAFYGYSYPARVYVTKEYFPTREYENFTLPAGIYDSLKIEIGEGKGHNWWCVMFPTVCLSGCTEDFSDTLTEEEIKMIESGHYVVRFKAVEIIEKIKSKI